MRINNLPEYADSYDFVLFHNLGEDGNWFYGAYPTMGRLCEVIEELYEMGDSHLSWCHGYEAVAA